MCQALHEHHSREDGFMFPALERQYPELDEVLARLRAEHVTVQRLLEELRALLAAADVDPDVLLSEVDRLIQELEAHLDYEEQYLVPLLN
jgi:hemerythrin-like domain-containing protein